MRGRRRATSCDTLRGHAASTRLGVRAKAGRGRRSLPPLRREDGPGALSRIVPRRPPGAVSSDVEALPRYAACAHRRGSCVRSDLLRPRATATDRLSGCTGRRTAARSAGIVVPSRIVRQMKRQVDGPVYLPSIKPPGYRYVSWKSYWSVTGRPYAGSDWYTVEFRNGAKPLTWTVQVPRSPCNEFAEGSARGGMHWQHLGGSAQRAWRCLRSRPRLAIDLFEVGRPLLPLRPLLTMLASAYRA